MGMPRGGLVVVGGADGSGGCSRGCGGGGGVAAAAVRMAASATDVVAAAAAGWQLHAPELTRSVRRQIRRSQDGNSLSCETVFFQPDTPDQIDATCETRFDFPSRVMVRCSHRNTRFSCTE